MRSLAQNALSFAALTYNACKSFVDGTCKKSKLKHIDNRQEWVQLLRNKNLFKARHVPGEKNLADLFTKILAKPRFLELREMCMFPCPHAPCGPCSWKHENDLKPSKGDDKPTPIFSGPKDVVAKLFSPRVEAADDVPVPVIPSRIDDEVHTPVVIKPPIASIIPSEKTSSDGEQGRQYKRKIRRKKAYTVAALNCASTSSPIHTGLNMSRLFNTMVV